MHNLPLPVPERELFAWTVPLTGGDPALADEALQHVRVQYSRGLYDRSRGSFRTWFTTVVRRYCFDARRYRFRATGGPDPLPDVAAPRAGVGAFEQEHDLKTPFCAADRSALFAICPRHRFVLLAWHGLWDKLTGEDQQATLAEVKPAEPFPVADFADWSARDRTRYLARALRCPTNTVAQIRLRYRHRLANLKYVCELRGL